MIYESRRQAAMKGYRPPATRRETGYKVEQLRLKQQLFEQRFRIHLTVGLWNYARRLGIVDPIACWQGRKPHFAKFADDLQDMVADILGVAEALPMPPHDQARTQLELAVATSIGIRRTKALRKLAIPEVIVLIDEAYGLATDEKSEMGQVILLRP